MRPILHVFDVAVLDRVEMDVISVSHEIAFAAKRVLSISPHLASTPNDGYRFAPPILQY
jgi:hypothetical protein